MKKDFPPIRKEVSRVIGFSIPKDWSGFFSRLEKEGKINTKKLTQIIVLLLEREEQREQ